MKKMIFAIILLFSISCSHQSINNIIQQSKLKYYGSDLTIHQIVDSTFQYYPRYLNFVIDTTYFPPYPNPFSPSAFTQYIFQLKDTSAINIELLDKNNKLLSYFSSLDNPPGYYLFYFNFKIRLEDDERILLYYSKLRFTFNDSTYIVPLASK